MTYYHQEIEAIRQRPGLHIDRKSISVLYNHLGGFSSAMRRLGISDKEEELLPLPVYYFHDFVANHYGWIGSTAGWRNIILQENAFDEEKCFDIFYELYDDFCSLAFLRSQYTKLSEKEVNYHYTNKHAPKKSIPPDYKTEPLFTNPVEMYLFELSRDAGYFQMINTDTHHCFHYCIHKDRIEAEEYLRQCFGSDYAWSDIDIKNYSFYLDTSF